MIFEIEFNKDYPDTSRAEKNRILKELGADLYGIYKGGFPVIEVNTLEDMAKIEKRVHELTGEYYSLVVGFDSPTIFLDKDV